MKLDTQAIRIIMAENELTQKAAALRCGLSAQRFSVILRIGDCTEVTAGKLARGLGVPVKDIIEKEACAPGARNTAPPSWRSDSHERSRFDG